MAPAMKPSELAARLLVIIGCLVIIAIPLGFYFSDRNHVIHARLAEDGGWSQQVIQAEAGQEVHLRLTSDDVMHSFAIGKSDQPAVDIEPGRITKITLFFDRPGTYTFYCTRWCGLNHWRMRGTIEVTGNEPVEDSATKPLYVSLGLDLDAPHQAKSPPEQVPAASEGRQIIKMRPDLERFLTRDYYQSHSPEKVVSDLGRTGLTESQSWAMTAEIWRLNTSVAELDQGRRLFAQNCAACHGEVAAGDGVFADDLKAAGESSVRSMAGSEAMSMQAPADLTDTVRILGASPALLQGKLLRGGMGTGMPMWGTIFTEEQTWDLVAYLYSLQFRY